MIIRSNSAVGAIAAAAVLFACSVTPAGSLGAETPVRFAPHRAVYDVALQRSSPGSGVAALSGRMVYEVTGSSCEGYAQRFRFVTAATDHDGAKQTSDLRTSTWEEAEGRKLRFSANQYQNEDLSSSTEGDAGRSGAGEGVDVTLAKPETRKLSFPGPVYFPMQHSAALIEAARAGRMIFSADLYDGSEKGDKISHVSAVIGKQSPHGSEETLGLGEAGRQLAGVSSWPVAIGFFDAGADRIDAVPTSEQTYRFYANGVSTDLVSDYGDYALRFELKALTFLDAGKCP